MRRLFWVAVGAAGAVVVARRLEQAARRYTPAGVTEQVEEAGRRTQSALKDAVSQWRASMDQRERDLVSTLLVTPEGGDAHAFRRRDRHERDKRDEHDEPGDAAGRRPSADSRRRRAADDAAAGERPSGRVDPDEPLYDF